MKHLYAGSYTADTGSKGIYKFEFDEAGGQLTNRVSYNNCVNPSFLAAGTDMIYAGSEVSENGGIFAFRRNSVTGELQYVNKTTVMGSGLCHLSIWPNSEYLSAANYSSGSLAVCKIMRDGSLGEITDFKQHQGIGFDKQNRQAGPHIHASMIDPSGKKLLVSDLGLDWLARYDVDINTGKLSLDKSVNIKTPDGSGPRHFIFSADGRYLYVVSEMGNTLLVYDYANARGLTSPMQQAALLPDHYEGESTAADIHFSPDGRYLYVSNRGHDSLVAFHVSSKDGSVRKLGHYSTHGAKPRNFCIAPDGRYVVIANQESNSIVVCGRDIQSGAIGAIVAQTTVPKTVFVMIL